MDTKSITFREIPLSTPPPIQSGMYDVCVRVKEGDQKNDRGKKRENEGERMRQREWVREWEKKRKRETVGLHVSTRVRATTFATARS